MSLSATLKQVKAKKKKKLIKPKLMLVGSFDDLFLEGLKELEFEFVLNKSSKPSKEKDVDVVVIGSDRTDQALDYVKKYKAVPIVYEESRIFADFNPIEEVGNAFVYAENSSWHMLAAVVRANETYKFSYDWKSLKEEVEDTAKYAKKNVY